jgi:hypothetical protein
MTPKEMEIAIIALQRENSGLISRVTALELNAAPREVVSPNVTRPAQLAGSDGTRIFHPIERAKIALPNDEELKKLLDVVFGCYPTLRPWTAGTRFASQDEEDFIRQFSAAFTFVAHQGRAEELDTKRSVGWWADQAVQWWSHRNARTNVGGGAFLAACVAAGDVDFQRSDQFGNIWAVALVTFGGRPATSAWQNVLRGQLRRPLPGVHKPVAPSSARVG